MYIYQEIMWTYIHIYIHTLKFTLVHVLSSTAQFLKERFKIDMPHRFKQHTFLGPTFCEMCGQLMHGIFRQQYKCEGSYKYMCIHTCSTTCTMCALSTWWHVDIILCCGRLYGCDFHLVYLSILACLLIALYSISIILMLDGWYDISCLLYYIVYALC